MTRVALIAVLASTAAHAWESACTKYANPSLEPSALKTTSGAACPAAGPGAARERWVGAIDEHRQLWEATRERAGLPQATSATKTLTVFTGNGTVKIGSTDAPTLVPAPFEAATRMRFRSFTPGELSQLPDFSYALWDWASGNETCALEGATSIAECHDFASHMGPVNSNHFVPQSQLFYAHYHSLAMARAAECAALKSKLSGTGARFSRYLEECELEALTLEAVGQHFLQDAWSMGHMWQRWGSSNLADFPGATTEEKRDRAVMIALVSGMFHGARSVLQSLPEWGVYDVNDAMCAPWDDVRFKTAAGTFAQGIGDNYVSLLPPTASAATYELQSKTFFDCAVSGMLEVYRAAGENHGAATPAMGLTSVDPTSALCFGQRATNASIARGAAVNLKVTGLQVSLPLDARFVSWMLPKVARSSGKVAVAPKVRNEFRFSLQRVVTMARLRAKDAPEGTDLAEGGLAELMGTKPNGQYATVAPYADPPLPWTPTTERTQHLTRLFHRGHATEWCEAMDLSALTALRTHAQDATLDVEAKATACTACAELVVRHVRVGTPSAYDTAQEPLCQKLTANPAFVYHQVSGVTDAFATASNWCCP